MSKRVKKCGQIGSCYYSFRIFRELPLIEKSQTTMCQDGVYVGRGWGEVIFVVSSHHNFERPFRKF